MEPFEVEQEAWRSMNPHNETYKMTRFNHKSVVVGRGTYGPLYVMSWNKEGEGLVIGHYCSISEGVMFILGGNHKSDCVSTFPFQQKILGEFTPPETKGKIIVGSDVWIGYGAVILSGVTVGQGAIIGAGSVVVRDVEPYTVVGGNPAVCLRSRFPFNSNFKTQIDEELLKLDYSKISPREWEENRTDFEAEIRSPEMARNIVNKLMRRK